MASGAHGFRTCIGCLRVLATEKFPMYGGKGIYRRKTCEECTASGNVNPKPIVSEPFKAEPPTPYRIRKGTRHRFSAEEVLASGEKERECLTCGALLRTRRDGSQYGSALEYTCEESQKLFGYTPEYSSKELSRVQANLKYLTHSEDNLAVVQGTAVKME